MSPTIEPASWGALALAAWPLWFALAAVLTLLALSAVSRRVL